MEVNVWDNISRQKRVYCTKNRTDDEYRHYDLESDYFIPCQILLIDLLAGRRSVLLGECLA